MNWIKTLEPVDPQIAEDMKYVAKVWRDDLKKMIVEDGIADTAVVEDVLNGWAEFWGFN